MIPLLLALVVGSPAWGKHRKYSHIMTLPVNVYFGGKALTCIVEQDNICEINRKGSSCSPATVFPLSMIKIGFEKRKIYTFPKSGEKWIYSEGNFRNISYTGVTFGPFRMFLSPIKWDKSDHPIGPYEFVFSDSLVSLMSIRAVFGKCFATEP